MCMLRSAWKRTTIGGATAAQQLAARTAGAETNSPCRSTRGPSQVQPEAPSAAARRGSNGGTSGSAAGASEARIVFLARRATNWAGGLGRDLCLSKQVADKGAARAPAASISVSRCCVLCRTCAQSTAHDACCAGAAAGAAEEPAQRRSAWNQRMRWSATAQRTSLTWQLSQGMLSMLMMTMMAVAAKQGDLHGMNTPMIMITSNISKLSMLGGGR